MYVMRMSWCAMSSWPSYLSFVVCSFAFGKRARETRASLLSSPLPRINRSPFAMDVDARASGSSANANASTSDYLARLQSQTPPSLHGSIETFERTSTRKLWHQLSNAIQAFLRTPESAPYQIELYDNFIAPLASKFDQLRLVEMAVAVAQQYEGGPNRHDSCRVEDRVKLNEARHILMSEDDLIPHSFTGTMHHSLSLGSIRAAQTATRPSSSYASSSRPSTRRGRGRPTCCARPRQPTSHCCSVIYQLRSKLCSLPARPSTRSTTSPRSSTPRSTASLEICTNQKQSMVATTRTLYSTLHA